jgi:hypothetical protein
MEVKNIEIGDVLNVPVEDVTQRVGITFDDEGEPLVGFVIVSKDSKAYRDTASRLRAAGIKRQANKRSRIDTTTDEGAVEFELAFAVVVDWFGFTDKGQPVPFNKNVVRQMFEKRPSWRERVSAALEAEENFLKLSTANSAISRAANSAIPEGERTE